MFDNNNRKNIIAATVVFGALLLAISFYSASFSSWSDDDKQNIQYFLRSLEANGQAQMFMSSRMNVRGELSPEDTRQALQLREEALRLATLTSDEVLAKAHRDLPEVFRMEYQRGLEISIQSLRRSLEGGVTHYEPEPLQSWSHWISIHKHEVRIPRVR